jgi:1,4-dihydroxy-6-naphthoate synthase
VIVAQRALGEARLRALEHGIAQSVRHARSFPAQSAAYIRQHAQEMSPEVCRQHIELYVNEFSIDMGDEGRRALDALLQQPGPHAF